MIVVGNFEKKIYFTWFRIKFQEKSPNFKKLAQKLQELSTKTWVNYFNGKFPYPVESCIANSLPLGQSKVVNPSPFPGGPSGFHLIAHYKHKTYEFTATDFQGWSKVTISLFLEMGLTVEMKMPTEGQSRRKNVDFTSGTSRDRIQLRVTEFTVKVKI